MADAFVVEVRASEQVVIFAVDLGFRSILVETDSLMVVKKLNSLKVDRSVLSPIIQDIKEMNGRFENISFDFMKRSGNSVSHALVEMGRCFLAP